MIVPTRITRELRVERVPTKWHENDASAFIPHTQDESFYERDISVLANGAEAGFDLLADTPFFEGITPELLTLVADDVFRGGAGGMNSACEEMRNQHGGGIVPEGLNTHHAPRMVVDDHRHPPTGGRLPPGRYQPPPQMGCKICVRAQAAADRGRHHGQQRASK